MDLNFSKEDLAFRDEVKENQLDENYLEEVVNYSKLKKLLSEKLNRVL